MERMDSDALRMLGKREIMPAVLFVCLGNICRSPAAEHMLRQMAEKNHRQDLVVDSCGLGDWYLGATPDERMASAAQTRGMTITGRAKKFEPEYLDQFDYILAVDNEIVHHLYRYAKTPAQKAKIRLITEFSEFYKGEEIPDPYYSGEAGFELVLDMLEDSCKGLLEHLGKL